MGYEVYGRLTLKCRSHRQAQRVRAFVEEEFSDSFGDFEGMHSCSKSTQLEYIGRIYVKYHEVPSALALITDRFRNIKAALIWDGEQGDDFLRFVSRKGLVKELEGKVVYQSERSVAWQSPASSEETE